VKRIEEVVRAIEERMEYLDAKRTEFSVNGMWRTAANFDYRWSELYDLLRFIKGEDESA